MSKVTKYISLNSLISTTQYDKYKFLLENDDTYENKEIFQKQDDENQSYDDKCINLGKNNYFCHEHMQTNYLNNNLFLSTKNFVDAYKQTFNEQKETNEVKSNLTNKDIEDESHEDIKSQDNNLIITINKKDTKKIFETTKYSYKIGNKISRRKSGRKQNIKAKILRNFIQDIIPSWIKCIKPGKNNKLNKDEIINYFKKYKDIKLSEIFQNQINISNYTKEDINYIKLYFTLKEAFLCFESRESSKRKDILLNVLNILKLDEAKYDQKNFFEDFDDVGCYIKRKAENGENLNKLEKAFSEIISDLSD